MIRTRSKCLVVAGLSALAGLSLAQESAPAASAKPLPDAAEPKAADPTVPAPLTKEAGLVMLDYSVVPVPGDKAIDLMGFHFLNRMTDAFYLGIGGYAPLVRGAYGGFMALDMTVHYQRRVYGNWFTNAGLSLGGGGGGRSAQQSKVLSGTGGFAKAYLGLGYDLGDVTLGLNYSRIKFASSNLAHSQFNVFAQVPFSYVVGSFASAGSRLALADAPDAQAALDDTSETMLSVGLDNFKQIDPRGTNKSTINAADLQFSHFMSKDAYWFFNAGVGYRGLPLYNQVLGGIGLRTALADAISLYGQLGIGSGGYAPEAVDTGPGLLVYPKLSAEVRLDKHLGLALSAGYLAAPKGSSKNYTVGAALNYHLHAGSAAGAGDGIGYQGYRVHLFPQNEFSVRSRGTVRDDIKMLSVQLDSQVDPNVYLPLQVSIAYNAYLGYPGYGELLAGIGLQTAYRKDEALQYFGQLLAGTNSHGAMLKTGVGLNFGLSDRSALYALVGQSHGLSKDKFRSNYLGIGLTQRFSVPSW